MDTNVKRKKSTAKSRSAAKPGSSYTGCSSSCAIAKSAPSIFFAESDQGNQPPVAGPGGDCRRVRCCDASRRLHVLHVSRTRTYTCARRIDGRRARRADGSPMRLARRQRRLDALTDVKKGAMGSYAIIGAHLPVAAGAAWSAQYRGTQQAAVCFFGDGTTNIGAFHEASIFPSYGSCPSSSCARTICIWNTRRSARLPLSSIRAADRASAYGLPSIRRRWQ